MNSIPKHGAIHMNLWTFPFLVRCGFTVTSHNEGSYNWCLTDSYTLCGTETWNPQRTLRHQLHTGNFACVNRFVPGQPAEICDWVKIIEDLLLLYNLHWRRVSLFGQIIVASCGGLVRIENCWCSLVSLGSRWWTFGSAFLWSIPGPVRPRCSGSASRSGRCGFIVSGVIGNLASRVMAPPHKIL